MTLRIYIPTLGRPNSQEAYNQLDAAGLKPVLVLDETDAAPYTGYRQLRVAVKGIAQKRQAIVEHAGKRKFAMLDDDIVIKAVDFDMLEKCEISLPSSARLTQEFERAEDLLDQYAHGGVHTRHFVNYAKQPYELNRGYYRQVAFFNPKLMGRVPRYTGETAEDVRFMVALLEQGLDYFIMTSCCMTEVKDKALPTHFRQEQKNKDMRDLGDEYPKFVRATKDGRITLSYAGILKAAKHRNTVNV